MRYRIMDVLLVSTPYDAFLLEEAGELEQTLGELRNLDLHYAPGLTEASTGASALEIAERQKNLNLIITTPHVGDMDAAELARRIRDAGIDLPVVLLAWDASELNGGLGRTPAIERVLSLAGRRAHPGRDPQVGGGLAQRRARHGVGRRAGHPPHRGQRPQLLLVPARDVQRSCCTTRSGVSRRAEHLAEDPAHAGAAEDPPLHRLRGGVGWPSANMASRCWASSRTSSSPASAAARRCLAPEPISPKWCARSIPDIPIVLHSSKPENRRLRPGARRQLPPQGLGKGSPTCCRSCARSCCGTSASAISSSARRRRDRRSAARHDLRSLEGQAAHDPRGVADLSQPKATISPAGSRRGPSSPSPTRCARAS